MLHTGLLARSTAAQLAPRPAQRCSAFITARAVRSPAATWPRLSAACPPVVSLSFLLPRSFLPLPADGAAMFGKPPRPCLLGRRQDLARVPRSLPSTPQPLPSYKTRAEPSSLPLPPFVRAPVTIAAVIRRSRALNLVAEATRSSVVVLRARRYPHLLFLVAIRSDSPSPRPLFLSPAAADDEPLPRGLPGRCAPPRTTQGELLRLPVP